MVERTVRLVVKKYLKKLLENGISVDRGIVFGSQVTGKMRTWSDIDLLVISSMFDEIKDRSDINMLWRVAARTDNRIEPIPCGEKQWLEDDSSAIIEYARRAGEVIRIN